MTAIAPGKLLGRQQPRVFRIPSSATDSLVEDALTLWELTGRELDPWQETTCEALFAVDALGNWAASEVGLLVSRQQGKGEVLQVYDLAHLFLWPKPNGERKIIVHTAHEFATVDMHYLKLKDRFLGSPWMRRQLKGGGVRHARGISGISTGMGRRVFELENGNLLILQSRTGGAGIGFTADVLVIDEAQHSPSETMEALLFTQDGVANTQVFYTGTVPTETQDGAHFEAVRDRGRHGGYPRTAWVEFSPDGSDDPDTAATIRMDDRDVWAQSSPALGRRTTEADIADKYEAFKDTNPDAFIKQRLSIWPNKRPEVERAANDLDLRKWNNNVVDLRVGDGLALAVSLGRGGGYSSICAAWRAPDDRILVEHLDTRAKTLWVPARLQELSRQHKSSLIVLDERNAAPIMTDLEKAGIKPFKMNTGEVGAAFELFIESVNAGDVIHPDQNELTLSLKHAVPRTMGRGLSTWEQGTSTEPVTLTQAATLAVWGLKKDEARPKAHKHVPITPGVLGGDLDAADGYTLTTSTSALDFLRR